MKEIKFKEEASALADEIIEWRRQIHAYPELGCKEFKTANLIADVLRELDIEVETEVGDTGVVGVLNGDDNGPTIALRADMDALPIQEGTDLPYASQNDGVMHACGHDAHVAMVLGVAKLLTEIEIKLPGNIKFIFQPNEEQPPGGAKGMISDGVLANPNVDAIAALHVNPQLPTGMLAVKEGPIMAAADKFTVKIKGQGGHGAAPHQTVDPIIVTTHVIQALQTIVSRQVDPLEAVVLSIGELQGGSSFNVIAEEVNFAGTVRTLNSELRKKMPQLIEKTISGVVDSFNAEYDLTYEKGYPILNNDKEMVNYLEDVSDQIIGKRKTLQLNNPSMGGEDFAYYAQKVPGVFAHLGVGKSSGEIYPWHHPKFNLDEAALSMGTAILGQLAYDYLLDQSKS
ncbi:MAG: amidohydrolase [Candidatus Frackibacter sp. T328-2]|nr:MAG: amidohydrolase [Candidatus Frackibacter sp. T328-2]